MTELALFEATVILRADRIWATMNAVWGILKKL